MFDLYMYFMAFVGVLITIGVTAYARNQMMQCYCVGLIESIILPFFIMILGFLLSIMAGYIIPVAVVLAIPFGFVVLVSNLIKRFDFEKIKKIWNAIKEA